MNIKAIRVSRDIKVIGVIRIIWWQESREAELATPHNARRKDERVRDGRRLVGLHGRSTRKEQEIRDESFSDQPESLY